MKPTALLLLCLVFTANFCSGQNLVPNPSFEEYDTCPSGQSQLYRATSWTININTADYYNICYDTSNSIASFGIPANVFGYQEAYSGNAYAGFYNVSKGGVFYDAREYLGAILKAPLIPGTKYYVSFRVSLADYSNCVTNNIGVKFLISTEYGDTAVVPPPLVDNTAHINAENIVSDSVGWVCVCGSFEASLPYTCFVIGNFFDYAHTDSIGAGCASYYYVDNVCISADSTECEVYVTGVKELGEDRLIFYPNPATSVLYCNLENAKGRLVTLYGTTVVEFDTEKSKAIDVKEVSDGTYLLMYEHEGRRYVSKQVIVH